jgi:hypothetical protein
MLTLTENETKAAAWRAASLRNFEKVCQIKKQGENNAGRETKPKVGLAGDRQKNTVGET